MLKIIDQYKKLINLNLNLKMTSKKDKNATDKMYFSITSFQQDEIEHLLPEATNSISSNDEEEEHEMPPNENEDTEESTNIETETNIIKQNKQIPKTKDSNKTTKQVKKNQKNKH